MAVAAIQEKYEVLREKAEDREAKEEATKKTQAEIRLTSRKRPQ